MRAAVLSLLAAGAAAAALELTPETFSTHVGGDKAALVMFYAPWCGHCKNLKPVWDELGSTFTEADGVVIAKLDADAHRDLGTQYDVKGFPTLIYFGAKDKKGESYSGGRDIDDLVSFVNKKLGTNKKVKKAPSFVTALDDATFDSFMAAAADKTVLAEFYAPWCGHCKSLAPTYEQVGGVFAGEPSVAVVKVDADKNKALGSRFGIQGFPTLKWITPGAGPVEDRISEYSGGRELADFVTAINEKAGTARDAKGGLLPTAGRLAAFDELVGELLAAKTPAAKAAALAEAREAAAAAAPKDKAAAELYVKVMAKAAEAPGYVAKEAARVASLLKSDAIAPAKRTDLLLRANVLAAFAPAA